MLKCYYNYANIKMRIYSAILHKEVKTVNGTWDSDYAYIYEFIAIIEKLFQVIANFFNSLGGGSTAAPETKE